MTREGIGFNIGMLRFDAPPEGSSMEQATRRFQTAVRELTSLLEHKESAGREHIVIVLTRVVASYQQSASPALLEPAREALQVVRALVLNENEEIPLRIHAMNLWTAIQPFNTPPLPGRRTKPGVPAPVEQLHARAAWLATLAAALKSPAEPIRDRAVYILMDSMRNPRAEDWYRDGWRKIVPSLAEATASKDGRVRGGVLAVLTWLGPEAVEALGTLRALARDSQDSALRLATEGVIRSISVKEGLTAKDPEARIAAAEMLGRMGWRAGPCLPALITAFADPDAKVRLAVLNSMRSLGHDSEPAVTTLATALPGETNASARVAIIESLETIAPGTRPVIDAHLNALHDPDPLVRKAAATFQRVPADESLIAALESTLGDVNDQVRLAAAGSLSGILFENPTVVPALVKAVGDETQRKAVLQSLDEHLEKVTNRADFARVRENLSGLQTTLGLAIPALRDALNIKNDEVSIRVTELLGRIVAFSHLSRDQGLQKAIAPALETFLLGLESSNPEVCQEVLAGLDEVPIRRADIVSALLRYLQRSDQTEEDHQAALLTLAAQTAFAESDSGLREGLKPAVPILLKALDSPVSEVRQTAVEALGHLGSDAKTAEETLRGLARNDPQPNVRKAAAKAVQAISGAPRKPASDAPEG
jgi:HEAT repeat protein